MKLYCLIEMQLNSLKGQLNPHFLFNTFNTLYGISLEFPERTRFDYEGVPIDALSAGQQQ
jgi:hypothetical protein